MTRRSIFSENVIFSVLSKIVHEIFFPLLFSLKNFFWTEKDLNLNWIMWVWFTIAISLILHSEIQSLHQQYKLLYKISLSFRILNYCNDKFNRCLNNLRRTNPSRERTFCSEYRRTIFFKLHYFVTKCVPSVKSQKWFFTNCITHLL